MASLTTYSARTALASLSHNSTFSRLTSQPRQHHYIRRTRTVSQCKVTTQYDNIGENTYTIYILQMSYAKHPYSGSLSNQYTMTDTLHNHKVKGLLPTSTTRAAYITKHRLQYYTNFKLHTSIFSY